MYFVDKYYNNIMIPGVPYVGRILGKVITNYTLMIFQIVKWM